MEKNITSPMHRFWLLIKPDQKEIRNVYVYAFFYGLVQLSLPVGIQAIINLIQGGQMSTSWGVLVACVILGVAVTGILQINQLRITENLQQKIFTRAAFEFTYRIPRIKLIALYKHYAPELMNRFFDIVSVQKGLSKILIDFSTASIQTVFGLLLLSLYHPFFIVFSLILIVLVYSIFKYTSRKGLETSLIESKSKYTVAHWLEELARTSVSFKLAGETNFPLEKTNLETKKYITAREDHFKVLKSQYILMVFFKVLVAAGLLIVGSILVMEQQMNIGQFVAAEIIILLVLNSVEKLILSLETIYDVITSLEKVGQVTDLEMEVETGTGLEHINHQSALGVELHQVDFYYPEQSHLVLNNASLSIQSGEKLLILGNGSAGKTTLLYLLSGMYKPKNGFISFNDLPIGNYNPTKLRSVIGSCLLEEQLFDGTILENITLGRDNITMKDIKWAISNIGLETFIKSLPNGLNSLVRAQGKTFSKGYIDKLILARSIVYRPKLLLIKDSFAALKSEERKRILNFLTAPSNPWTLIMVSNDEEISSQFDRTVYFANGTFTQ